MSGQHPLALTLSTVIYGERGCDQGLEYAVYRVIETMLELAGFSEERKADLYATLAEKLTGDMPLIDMERVCSRALWDNENWWAAQ